MCHCSCLLKWRNINGYRNQQKLIRAVILFGCCRLSAAVLSRLVLTKINWPYCNSLNNSTCPLTVMRVFLVGCHLLICCAPLSRRKHWERTYNKSRWKWDCPTWVRMIHFKWKLSRVYLSYKNVLDVKRCKIGLWNVYMKAMHESMLYVGYDKWRELNNTNVWKINFEFFLLDVRLLRMLI